MKNSNLIRIGITAAALLLGAAALWEERSLRTREQTGSAGQLAPDLPVGSVGKIELRWGIHAVTLVQNSGEWIVQERQISAEPRRIRKLLEAVRNLRPVKKIVPVSDAMLSRLRLKEKDRVPGMRITFRNSENRILYDLMTGKLFFLPQEQPAAPGSRPVPDGRYMAKIGTDGKMVPFLTSATLEEFLPIPGAWIRLPAFDAVERTFQIRFVSENPKECWLGVRNNFARNFEFLIPAGTRSVSVRMVREMFRILAGRYAVDVVSEDAVKDRKPAGVLELTDDTGLVRRLRFFRDGKKPESIFCTAEATAVKGAGGVYSASASQRASFFRKTAEKRLYVIHPKVYRLLTEIPEEKRKK